MIDRTPSICPSVPGIDLGVRPITAADADFLFQVYAETREEELAVVDWSPAQKHAFLKMQFDAQHAHYQKHYPAAAFDLILLSGQPIGRIYLDRWATEFRIVDIALLRAYRNRGIGTAFLQAIHAAAQHAGLPVTIHVEQFNPALRLYQRLGFEQAGENGVYFLMKWPA